MNTSSQTSTLKYNIKFFNTTIETIVTNSSNTITTWIEENIYLTDSELIGLDVMWRPELLPNVTNKAATLQLCVDKKCIIIQLLYLDEIPSSLREFLADPNVTFVGYEIDEYLKKLKTDHGLCHSTNFLDIWAAARDRWPGRFARPGLKNLAIEVCEMFMTKPIHVTMSQWHSRILNKSQVEYACIDAFASYKIGHAVLCG